MKAIKYNCFFEQLFSSNMYSLLNKNKNIIKIIFGLSILGVLFLIIPMPSRAANQPYAAELVKASHPYELKLKKGDRITFWAEFKNTGTKTWKNSGDGFIAINVTDPTGHNGIFRDKFWKDYYRPCVMATQEVKPGEIGQFNFAITAPDSEGWYLEHYGLVSENQQWIGGGNLAISMKVGNPLPHWQAKLAAKSHELLVVDPGVELTIWAEFTNTGAATWTNYGDHYVALNVTDPSGRTSGFRHNFWVKSFQTNKIKATDVPTNGTGRVEFAIKAPNTAGRYIENFNLVAENLTWIPGGHVNFIIKVRDKKPVSQPAPPEPISGIEGEMNIRVGLYDTTDNVVVTADGDFEAQYENGEVIASYKAGTEVMVGYVGGTYALTAGGQAQNLKSFPRLVPKNSPTIIKVISFENKNYEGINDNLFRGLIEVQYADSTDSLWVINELGLESYLRGVAEAWNGDNPEYLKTLMTAARTYAMYHILTGGRNKNEHFHVDDDNDQVYRGYGFESRSPNITQAIIDTAGKMVTYNNEVVVTPYFSRSDGRTRAWEEVWYGDPKPWLISVDDPGCKGMTKLGHGVGLSAYGARYFVTEKGWTYQQTLTYYYTGTEVKKIY